VKLTVNRRLALTVLIIGILLIASAVLVYVQPWQAKPVIWNVELIGETGQQKALSYKEILAMPAYSGKGGFFTTVGIVNGPYRVKGVPLSDLGNLVGGITPDDVVMVSATDGYSSVFDYEKVMGDFITYDPQTIKEVPHGELKLVLMYELDGKPLSQDGGKPLRLAIIGTDGLLTEGNMWLKWVSKIEVMKISQ
jgi:DMSO/TMAO reductase YedYZ molybdopterin-dependent catalytic subunit